MAFPLAYINVEINRDLIFDEIKISSGSQGDVYKADYAGQVVAVKLQRMGQFDDKMLARLQHPNIVRIIFSGLSSEKRLLVMEYCPRQLYKIVHDTPIIPINCRDFRNWTWQLANAMEFLHGQTTIVHRDLKSPNILIALDNGLRLCDFELSKAAPTHNTHIFTTRAGTHRWMAPEILTNDDSNYTKRADVWSYGVVVWEMVTQQIPYLDVADFEKKFKNKELYLPYPVDLMEPYRSLFMSCLDFDESKRPNFEKIRKELEIYLHPNKRVDTADWASRKERWLWQAYKYDRNSSFKALAMNGSENGLNAEDVDEPEIDVDHRWWHTAMDGFEFPLQFHFVGTPQGTRFHVNFYIGGNIAFHFNPIFKRRNQVVRNAMHPDADVFYIDEEECGHMVQFPFRLNQIFDLLFKAQNNVIMVDIDGKQFTQFAMRYGYKLSAIDKIAIVGNVIVHKAEILHG